jgi:hypothetical protein
MMQQATLDFSAARAAGRAGAEASLNAAEKEDPEFSTKAKAAILAHLRVVGQASGEELVEIAKLKGAVPRKGDRAFGGVFLALSSQKNPQIRCIRSDLPRKRGHGTSGGKLWGLVQ